MLFNNLSHVDLGHKQNVPAAFLFVQVARGDWIKVVRMSGDRLATDH